MYNFDKIIHRLDHEKLVFNQMKVQRIEIQYNAHEVCSINFNQWFKIDVLK